MIRGLYTAASGMISSLVANDTLANNLANVNTTGFKKSEVSYQSFPDLLITKMSSRHNPSGEVGRLSTGSRVRESRIDHSQGAMMTTGNTFDMALEGPGFFTLQTKTGKTLYTRAGDFTVDGEGFLTTVNGDYVMGKLGRINIRQDQPPYQIKTNGEISGKGRVIDTLQITAFKDPERLMRVGDTAFEETPYTEKLDETNQHDALPFSIHAGTLERSNTNVISELVNSITGMRLYEALQKNIHLQNETLQKAVNEVGRYR